MKNRTGWLLCVAAGVLASSAAMMTALAPSAAMATALASSTIEDEGATGI